MVSELHELRRCCSGTGALSAWSRIGPWVAAEGRPSNLGGTCYSAFSRRQAGGCSWSSAAFAAT